MKLLVCGGRDFCDTGAMRWALEVIDAKKGIEMIIQGGADGADRLAAEWGWEHGKRVGSFPAEWDKHGRKAGPIRNQEMIDEGKPDGVLAFPGGKGTADMVRRAEAAGIPVWKPKRSCG